MKLPTFISTNVWKKVTVVGTSKLHCNQQTEYMQSCYSLPYDAL